MHLKHICTITFIIIFLFKYEITQAQVAIEGYRYDFDFDTLYEATVVMDTSTEEFNSYTTTYNIYGGKDTTKRKPVLTIFLTHYPPDKTIELVVKNNKTIKKTGIQPEPAENPRFRYGLFGNMIVGNKNDTLPFDSTYKFYNIVYFFGDNLKKKYVYLNQIGELYTQLPNKFILNPIPSDVYRLDSIAQERFKLEGTEERRYANWLKDYEAFRLDSIRLEDSIRAAQLNVFLELRKDTFIEASADTSIINALALKKKIQEIALGFRKGKMKFDGTFGIKTDTMGYILSAEPNNASSDSHDFRSFEIQLAKALTGIQVQGVSRSFQGRNYAMQTKFELRVTVFCDSLLQTLKKERDTIEYGIHLYDDENLTRNLSRVLTEKGRYSFVLYFSELLGEKYYYISKLTGGGRNYGDMVFGEQ